MKRILTLHPQGKKGVNISVDKYNRIRAFILNYLQNRGPTTYEELSDIAVKELSSTFEGSVVWYVVSVKLDLEARNIIYRIPKTSPHKVGLIDPNIK